MCIPEKWQVLASPSYPVNEWLDLGTFTAKFVQGEQTFDLPEPVFARYVYTYMCLLSSTPAWLCFCGIA